jgi:hypothetical protein
LLSGSEERSGQALQGEDVNHFGKLLPEKGLSIRYLKLGRGSGRGLYKGRAPRLNLPELHGDCKR